MTAKIQISELHDNGDARGFGFTTPAEALAFVGRVADMHLASTKPGAVRGNHYHARRRSAIVVLPGSKWSFHWDEGEGSAIQRREFDGRRAILVLIWPNASHAVRNDGDGDLYYVSISSEAYDPAGNVPRKVV
jgi:dTDP-4-dehydrorhamnose 3,5-epimerase-like enzyme